MFCGGQRKFPVITIIYNLEQCSHLYHALSQTPYKTQAMEQNSG
jgi:hypothetical protein